MFKLESKIIDYFFVLHEKPFPVLWGYKIVLHMFTMLWFKMYCLILSWEVSPKISKSLILFYFVLTRELSENSISGRELANAWFGLT